VDDLAALGPTASLEQISELVVLPVWTVQRRMTELTGCD